MSDQMHPTPPAVPVLSALCEQAEFQRGLTEAKETFLEDYDPAPLSEEEMITEVELELSRRMTERAKLLARLDEGWPCSSYLYHLGYVVGIINEGLTYAR